MTDLLTSELDHLLALIAEETLRLEHNAALPLNTFSTTGDRLRGRIARNREITRKLADMLAQTDDSEIRRGIRRNRQIAQVR